MKIDGIIEKLEPIMEELGTFKLKDRVGRNVVQVDLTKVSRPLTEAMALFVSKIYGESNKIRISIQWKPKIERVIKNDEVQK